MRMLISLGMLCSLALVGCKSDGGRPAPTSQPAKAESSTAALEQRVHQLWKARLAEDWSTAYDFQYPALREKGTREAYVNWAKDSEPFIYDACEIHRVESDGPFGWAEMTDTTRIRKMPQLKANTINRWEKWTLINGAWYPVLPPDAKFFPEALSIRNLPEEKRLKERFEAVWRARYDHDWERMEQFVDPADRDQVTADQIEEAETQTLRLSYKILWIDVVGDRGRVFALYDLKISDPSQAKRPPWQERVLESCVNRDGIWYLNFKN